MTKKEFQVTVTDLFKSVLSLETSPCIRCDTALYAFLVTAEDSLRLALNHLDEYDEERI